MAFNRDYTSQKITITQDEHRVDGFPIVQVFAKEGDSYAWIGCNILINSEKEITIEFSSPAEVKVVVK